MSCTLSDVITYVPFERTNGDSQTPHDYLNQLLNLISRLRGGASRYVPLLMAKVAENLPNMANPLSHMPPTLDAFIDGSPCTSSSTQSLRQNPSRAPTSLTSPSQQSTFSASMHPPSLKDNVQSPQSQHMPQQDRLMFESYSPSVNSHSEAGRTPPIYGMQNTSIHQYAPPTSAGQHAQPRSIPLATPGSKEEWVGYNG